MSREEFPETHAALAQAVKDGVAPGFVAGIGAWQSGSPLGKTYALAMGQRRTEPTAQSISTQTVYDLASLTKVMATAALAAVLVERGWLSWNSRVASFFPNYPFRDIEIHHLLSHTAGFPAIYSFWDRIGERFKPRALHTVAVRDRQRAMRELVLLAVPEAPPGSRALYSDLSFLLLGFVLEEALQMPLDRAVEVLVWKPMGVKAKFFHTTHAPNFKREEIAATELSPWHKVILQGQVHDENCWAMGGYGGQAGAFGNMEDVLRFAGSLMTGFFTQDTLRAIWTRAKHPPDCERTYGWDTRSGNESSAGRFFSDASVGHLGFTGTSLWIDPPERLAVSLLSNRVHPTRENIAIRQFRPIFHNAIRADWSRLSKPR
jgi:CubicO group peptidase (beta-lactamase class C family)